MAAADKKISALVTDQIPDFVKEDGPKFEAFIKAYYEWMERDGNAMHATKKLIENQDIDTTTDAFLDFLKREIFRAIPDFMVADKRLIAKRITDLYRTKGSTASYKFLFRAMFDEDIDVYFPGDYILKTSDGRWLKETSVQLTGLTAARGLFLGKIVTGGTSGATGRAQRIEIIERFGVQISELFLSDIIGTFSDGEIVTAEDDSVEGIVFNDTGVLSGVEIQTAGIGHKVGDAVNFIASSGSGANGNVSAVDDTSAINFSITEGGQGYRSNSIISIAATIGEGAGFSITTLSNTEVLSIGTDLILPMANVVIGTGPLFPSLGTNTATLSANMAAANSSSNLINAFAFNNITVGTINSITVTSQGSGYTQLPTVSIVDTEIRNQQLVSDISIGGIKGNNAVIAVAHAPGAMRSATVNDNGADYSKFEVLTVDNQTRAATNATAAALISGTISYEGKYTDTKGWLSWDNRLQDGDFYQEYSYVIRSENFVEKYREAVKEILHPSGTKMFGDVMIISDLNHSVVIDKEMVITRNLAANADVQAGIIDSYVANVIIIVPEIEDELEATQSYDGSSMNINYDEGGGTIFIVSNTELGRWASTPMGPYALIELGDFGTSRMVNGNTTFFESIFSANCNNIEIRDTAQLTANGMYSVKVASSNTVLAIFNAYESSNGALDHGTYWAANTLDGCLL